MNSTVAHNVTPSAGSPIDFKPLFDELNATFRSGRTHDLAWRDSQLSALERMMKEREGDIIDALHQDLGRHGLESWTAEIAYVAGDAA
ncbi:MAG: aldehyde dehydrogenase family protein, partial [Gammaproteobacteria bacterium]|nr:aldehyde dehydrogenase family protein [Gammaproteobacteria bacterium]